MTGDTTCDECGKGFDTHTAMRVHQSQVGHMDKPWRDEGKLREMYVERRLSAYEIADELGCGATAVYTALDDFGIARRSTSESKKIAESRKPAGFTTLERDGYEIAFNSHNRNFRRVPIHVLAAVAWFGYEKVRDGVVHHKEPIEWLNVEWNLEVLESQSEHAKLHNPDRERDERGRYA